MTGCNVAVSLTAQGLFFPVETLMVRIKICVVWFGFRKQGLGIDGRIER